MSIEINLFLKIFLFACLSFFSAFFSLVRPVFNHIWENEFYNLGKKERYYVDKIKGLYNYFSHITKTIFLGRTLFNALLILLTPLLFWPGLFDFFSFFRWFAYVIVMALYIVVFLQIAPITLGRAMANKPCVHFVTYNIYIFFARLFLLIPIVPFLNFIEKVFYGVLRYDDKYRFLSEEQRHEIFDPTVHSTKLKVDEKEMIKNIFKLGETEVKEIMVPRVDMFALEFSSTLDEILKAFYAESHSRIPIYRETIDNIEGILHGKDILRFLHSHESGEWDLSRALRKPYFVPINKKLDDLLREFKRTKNHIAIVVDQYGGTAGLVTMEDILEEIVGDIKDEHDTDEEQMIKHIDDLTFEVDPKINIGELERSISIGLSENDWDDYDTLGGLIFTLAKAVPKPGQEFRYANIKIKVLTMDGQRIERVRITKKRR